MTRDNETPTPLTDAVAAHDGNWDTKFFRMKHHAEWLEKQLARMRATFDLRWDADMRAIKTWHDAGNPELTWPDHADLVVFLMGQLAEAVQSQSDLTDQLKIREAELQQARRDKERLESAIESAMEVLDRQTFGEHDDMEVIRDAYKVLDAAMQEDAQ